MNGTTILIVSLIGLVLPVASARISKAHWDASITGLITGGLAAVVSFGGELVQGGSHFDWKTAAVGTLTAWFTGHQLTQSGILSNTQAEASLLNAGSKHPLAIDANPDPTVGLDYDDTAPEPQDVVDYEARHTTE